MPYRNPRNIGVAQQMSDINQTHINREQQINDFSTTSEVPSQLESMVMRRPEVHGGSGYAAATNKDLGFEPTLGATGGADTIAAKRRVRKKAIEVGEGLSAAGVSAGSAPPAGSSTVEGISGGAKPTRTRKKERRRTNWRRLVITSEFRHDEGTTTRHNSSEGNYNSIGNLRRRRRAYWIGRI